MKIGDKIKVNNGETETLIERERNFGLFQSGTYQVVRNLLFIKEEEIIIKEARNTPNA